MLWTLTVQLAACTGFAAGSAFSYQGRLSENGLPANAEFDLRFELFGQAAGGTPTAGSLTNTGVKAVNGLFTTTLDFGTSVFNGASTWLEIGVRPAGDTADFVILVPRQSLTPTPYSIYTLKAESLTGPLPDSQLSSNVARLDANQTFSGTVSFSGSVAVGALNASADLEVNGAIRAGQISGNGSGLSNVVASGVSAKLIEKLWRTAIPFVTVGDPGNPPNDLDERGAVAYPFRIGKFEINNKQYAAFLNAVGADDIFSLYNSNMTSDAHGGITRSGSPGDHSYAVKPGKEHEPVVWVDFRDAVRFCNWLHNGQPSGSQDESTTEDGAYTITDEALLLNILDRNPTARFWLPSGDEWYKAAYYQPYEAGGDPSYYWLFPTRSNDVPVSEPPPGGANSVNACCETGRNATDVGAYRNAPSYYGTFDQAGNVEEWTEEIVFITNRRLRGGSWGYNEFYSKSTDLEFDTIDYPAEAIGFRVAGALD